MEAIEDAFDKIIAQRFKARRKTGKINLKPVKASLGVVPSGSSYTPRAV